MKQGITHHMAVRFDGVRLDEVSRIEFVFTQTKRGSPLKTSLWTAGEETGDAIRHGEQLLVPWSREETYLFQEEAAFYLDTRITMAETGDNPETPIVPLRMNPTLFEKEETP